MMMERIGSDTAGLSLDTVRRGIYEIGTQEEAC
jgi:hypothetical protein